MFECDGRYVWGTNASNKMPLAKRREIQDGTHLNSSEERGSEFRRV